MRPPIPGETPRIAVFDIETSPLLAWVWGMFEQNVIEVHRDWYILSFAYKWLGEKRTYVHALPDYPLYQKDPHNDFELLADLWKLFSEADVLIGHNSDRFDIKKVRGRFLLQGMLPPRMPKSIDTLKAARKEFKLDSNRLDSIGKATGLGGKTTHTGKKLWLDCIAGDPKAWGLMKRYNKRDVELGHAVYLKMRPFMQNHPNLTHYTGQTANCGSCQSTNTQHRGWNHTATGKRKRIQCQDCGAWGTTGNLVRAK